MQFRVKLGCPLKTGEYRVRVYHFKPDDKKVDFNEMCLGSRPTVDNCMFVIYSLEHELHALIVLPTL